MPTTIITHTLNAHHSPTVAVVVSLAELSEPAELVELAAEARAPVRNVSCQSLISHGDVPRSTHHSNVQAALPVPLLLLPLRSLSSLFLRYSLSLSPFCKVGTALFFLQILSILLSLLVMYYIYTYIFRSPLHTMVMFGPLV
jgi:hypothetical protein